MMPAAMTEPGSLSRFLAIDAPLCCCCWKTAAWTSSTSLSGTSATTCLATSPVDYQMSRDHPKPRSSSAVAALPLTSLSYGRHLHMPAAATPVSDRPASAVVGAAAAAWAPGGDIAPESSLHQAAAQHSPCQEERRQHAKTQDAVWQSRARHARKQPHRTEPPN